MNGRRPRPSYEGWKLRLDLSSVKFLFLARDLPMRDGNTHPEAIRIFEAF